jgi:hypothetical protein
MVCGEPDVEVPRQPVLADDDTCVLDGLVREQELCAHHRSLRAVPGVGDERIEPACFRNGVVVQEDDVFTAAHRRAVVAGSGKAAVRLPPDGLDGIAIGAEQLRGRIGGRIVDHDRLAGDVRRVSQQRLEALPRKCRMVVDGDDDRASDASRSHSWPSREKITQVFSSRTTAE